MAPTHAPSGGEAANAAKVRFRALPGGTKIVKVATALGMSIPPPIPVRARATMNEVLVGLKDGPLLDFAQFYVILANRCMMREPFRITSDNPVEDFQIYMQSIFCYRMASHTCVCEIVRTSTGACISLMVAKYQDISRTRFYAWRQPGSEKGPTRQTSHLWTK
ncbi:hypothetical protein IFR04_009521 [Cadophora malorum]|uniref:Uncharacterized protein n=1 Tax=Cadophora malorum TaxID=108018 RepID=A0A8H7TDY1_9HELO|nr:hypothetical protein IFR04_009521 [Cadophora malorum]